MHSHYTFWLFLIVLLLSAALCEARLLPESAPVISGAARVYDGDSIFFGRAEVRLDAIDAPEHDQACKDREGISGLAELPHEILSGK